VPDRLYGLLPAAYVLCGLFALFYFSYFTAAISGLLLIGAGVLVFAWRCSAKAAQRRQTVRQQSLKKHRHRGAQLRWE